MFSTIGLHILHRVASISQLGAPSLLLLCVLRNSVHRFLIKIATGSVVPMTYDNSFTRNYFAEADYYTLDSLNTLQKIDY